MITHSNWHLDGDPNVLTANGPKIGTVSSCGTYIATANHGEGTVTVTSSGTLSQLIDTDIEIAAMALVNNVLSVVGPEELVAWLLVEGGTGEWCSW